jgi:hypothetical protein
MTDPKIEMLRHTVATLAYRSGKSLRDTPLEGFADFTVAPGCRTPLEILAHLGDLIDWAASAVRGAATWQAATPGTWEEETERFFRSLATLDELLAAGVPPGYSAEQAFQGPIADALTHCGQLAMLRRIAGAPVRSENYARAEIVAGRVGREQTAPRREF